MKNAIIVLSLLFFANATVAQTAKPVLQRTISGFVKDSSGVAIKGAAIRFLSPRQDISAVTDSNGMFEFYNVIVSRFGLLISAEDYKYMKPDFSYAGTIRKINMGSIILKKNTIKLNDFLETIKDIEVSAGEPVISGKSTNKISVGEILSRKSEGPIPIMLPDSILKQIEIFDDDFGLAAVKSKSDARSSMQPSTKTIEETPIIGRLPIIYKTDTIQYRAVGYRVKRDAKVADLLSKMEGFEVSVDNSVTHQGKDVNLIKINGKNSPGLTIKSVIKTLQADAVATVEVIDVYKHFDAISGDKRGDPDKLLNINLKPGTNINLNTLRSLTGG